jgi:hypothetical protein
MNGGMARRMYGVLPLRTRIAAILLKERFSQPSATVRCSRLGTRMKPECSQFPRCSQSPRCGRAEHPTGSDRKPGPGSHSDQPPLARPRFRVNPDLMAFMLRHTFVTTMLDAGVDPRDVQIAARYADPRTTRAGSPEPGPPPNYILGPSATSSASLRQAVRPRSARRTVTG